MPSDETDETMGFTQNTAMRQKRSGGSEVAVTSGRHAQKAEVTVIACYAVSEVSHVVSSLP